MITISCVGNRYLEIRRMEDGRYEVRIMVHRGKKDIYIAALVIEEEEFAKIRGLPN